jgi:hypothetical protein
MEHLHRELDRALEAIESHHLTHLVRESPDQVLAQISTKIGDVFDVSAEVIETRAVRESLWPPA